MAKHLPVHHGLRSIVRQELRNRRWALVWWTIGIGAFVSINILVYPSFRDQADQLNSVFAKLPEATRDLFSDTGEFMSPAGYLSSQVFYLMLPLLMSFLSVGIGASLIAREERDKTIELLLARPVSRATLLFGKAAAGLAAILLVGVPVGILCSLEVAAVGFAGISAMRVFAATMFALLLSLLFSATAFCLTALGRFGRGASLAVAALIGLGGYIVSSLDGVVAWLRPVSKVFPYHYYQPAELLHGTVPWPVIGVFSALVLLLAIVGYLGFRRRDIG